MKFPFLDFGFQVWSVTGHFDNELVFTNCVL